MGKMSHEEIRDALKESGSLFESNEWDGVERCLPLARKIISQLLDEIQELKLENLTLLGQEIEKEIRSVEE